jgi:hypothetical protein
MMRTVDRQYLARIARLAAIALFCVALGGPAATAEDGSFGGFFEHFFGGGTARSPEATETPVQPVHRPRKRVRDFVPATTTRLPGTPGGAPVQPTFFIDVLGDSLGVLAAGGLSDAFADKPEVAIADKAREASGLVRDDYFDWDKTAQDLAAGKDHIDFVVVMIGINDLQPMRDGADTLSDAWRSVYAQRVEALVAPFAAAHIPVAWVGLPPMRTEKVNAEVAKLNEMYREHAEKAGAKYIDIWDAFADQNGQYDAFGPNVDGQNVKLRGADGIHFTKAGARKVAHFLEAEIKRVMDKNKPQNETATLPPDIEQAAGDINAQIRREMGAPGESAAPGSPAPLVPSKPLAGPILSLTARPISPGGALAAREATLTGEPQAVARVLRYGEPADPRAGRADDFSWPHL